jgi:hypothetical protein
MRSPPLPLHDPRRLWPARPIRAPILSPCNSSRRSSSIVPGRPIRRLGALVLTFAADAQGAPLVRLGIVRSLGPAWHSRGGGRIDRRITLDLHLSSGEEGGPVVDAAGALLGMSTAGPRGRVLVIPASTSPALIRLVQPAREGDGRLTSAQIQGSRSAGGAAQSARVLRDGERERLMPDTLIMTERSVRDQVAEYDAIVIGAGISGMYMLYRLRELGMTARVFEAGTNVGGPQPWTEGSSPSRNSHFRDPRAAGKKARRGGCRPPRWRRGTRPRHDDCRCRWIYPSAFDANGLETVSMALRNRTMTLVAFLQAQNCSNLPGSSRHPATMLDFLTPEYYQRIARTLEDGKIQMAFLDDRLALPDIYTGHHAEAIGAGVRAVKLDPCTIMMAMGMVTRRLGRATYSTTYY